MPRRPCQAGRWAFAAALAAWAGLGHGTLAREDSWTGADLEQVLAERQARKDQAITTYYQALRSGKGKNDTERAQLRRELVQPAIEEFRKFEASQVSAARSPKRGRPEPLAEAAPVSEPLDSKDIPAEIVFPGKKKPISAP